MKKAKLTEEEKRDRRNKQKRDWYYKNRVAVIENRREYQKNYYYTYTKPKVQKIKKDPEVPSEVVPDVPT